MRSIKYIAPDGRQILFSRERPYIFSDIKGIGPVSARIESSVCAGKHGSLFAGLSLEDREITLKYIVDSDSLYTRLSELRSVCSSVGSAKGERGRLEYANDNGSWWIPAVVKIGPSVEKKHRRLIEGSVVFYCEDPLWRSEKPQIERLAAVGGGLTFPLIIEEGTGVQFGSRQNKSSIYNLGDAPAPVKISIYGPAKNPRIINTNTGEELHIIREISEGDILVINTYFREMEASILHENNLKESAFGYLDANSVFFQLTPGENEIMYESEDDASQTLVTLETYSRFGGV